LDFYTSNAQRLAQQYDSLSPEQVHADWIAHLPSIKSNQTLQALDLGAGSGRDASWLAGKSWDVLAVEPSVGLSRLGEFATHGQDVRWLNDTLPALASIPVSYDASFDLILASAMWMHLTPAEQVQSLLRLTQLAAPVAVLVITWRNQADEAERVFYPVDAEQFKAGQFKLLAAYSSADEGGREGVVWQCVVLENEVCGFGK
jgi:SAM-dependent methyltransferase